MAGSRAKTYRWQHRKERAVEARRRSKGFSRTYWEHKKKGNLPGPLIAVFIPVYRPSCSRPVSLSHAGSLLMISTWSLFPALSSPSAKCQATWLWCFRHCAINGLPSHAFYSDALKISSSTVLLSHDSPPSPRC
jgi:hypothetical protein